MNFKRLNVYPIIIALFGSVESKIDGINDSAQKDMPLHYYTITVGGIVLLVLSILIYWHGLQESKRVEFTVFNSQYIGK
jgi:hypothetical protein